MLWTYDAAQETLPSVCTKTFNQTSPSRVCSDCYLLCFTCLLWRTHHVYRIWTNRFYFVPIEYNCKLKLGATNSFFWLTLFSKIGKWSHKISVIYMEYINIKSRLFYLNILKSNYLFRRPLIFLYSTCFVRWIFGCYICVSFFWS